MREQFRGDVEQFLDAGAAARGDEAHRHQVAFAQALLERVVQFLALEAALAEVEVVVHHRLVDLDHLVDDLLVPVGDRAEVAVAGGLPEAVGDALAALGRQVERQHFGAEGFAQVVEQGVEFGARVVDLVDDDHPAQVARLGVLHHPARAVADAGVGIDHDRDGFHRGQRGQGGAAEIRIAGRVDQVDVDGLLAGRRVVDAGDGRVDGVAALLLDRIEIGHRAAAFDRACRLDRAAGMQQGFEQDCFAGARVACEGHVADLLCGVRHEAVSPMVGGRRRADRSGRSLGRIAQR